MKAFPMLLCVLMIAPSVVQGDCFRRRIYTRCVGLGPAQEQVGADDVTEEVQIDTPQWMPTHTAFQALFPNAQMVSCPHVTPQAMCGKPAIKSGTCPCFTPPLKEVVAGNVEDSVVVHLKNDQVNLFTTPPPTPSADSTTLPETSETTVAPKQDKQEPDSRKEKSDFWTMIWAKVKAFFERAYLRLKNASADESGTWMGLIGGLVSIFSVGGFICAFKLKRSPRGTWTFCLSMNRPTHIDEEAAGTLPSVVEIETSYPIYQNVGHNLMESASYDSFSSSEAELPLPPPPSELLQ